MTRLPWEHGSTPRMHDEDGGESLNADVMRFVAILALCLVALFALVRSIPLAAPVATDTAPPTDAGPSPSEPAKRAPAPSPPMPAPPEPVPSPVDEVPEPVETRVEAPRAVREPPTPDPQPGQAAPDVPANAPPAVPAEGFSLRFESDGALQRLIADGRIRVYARPEGGRWWVSARSRLAQFQPAAAPVQIYEMHPGTVPRSMLQALDRDRGLPVTGPVMWGVSLPPELSGRIGELVEGRRAGHLIITEAGAVTLQPSR